MADFSKRPDEMLKELEVVRSVLPEQALKNFQDAIAKYKSWRRDALEDLLEVLEEDDDDESARSWVDLCNTMRADAPEFFEDALKNIVLGTEAAAAGYRWQLTLMANEGKFFEELGKANAAQVRDYLVTNRESLRDYTQTLDQKWRTIVDEGNKLQSEEKKLYDEMLEMTKRIVEDFGATERTYYEQMRNLAQYPLIVAEKLGGTIADLAGLPDGVGEIGEQIAEKLRDRNAAWLESNRALQGRAANYRSLVQAEKGGVLPLFKETRRQVYEYWDKNNVERARDWLKKFQSSLESEWVAHCPTYGQQDDARDFYRAALERVEKHLQAVETVGKEFEEKWNGVFKGALAAKTIDELVDNTPWRVNAETLVSIRTPAVVTELLKKMDGYYEESFEQPLAKLKDKAEDLTGEMREEALRAIELARKRVEQSVRDRIKAFQAEIGASLRWFDPDEIKKTLDRSELEDGLGS
ncbi:MAG: hypothetical protein ABI821_04185 [Pseudomonadota bacterium]